MAYPRSSPHSTHSREDWDLKSKMSKTTSTGSTTYSVASASSRLTNASVQESSARVYFIELQRYLSSMLSKEASEGVPAQRTAARQKLSRLNNLQFHELATDVYDELVRRNVDGHKSFLPLRDDFHPRRNQARQKLATLPDSRFKDLASDVYHELKRRYPHILEEDVPPMPQPKSMDAKASQSTQIVPVKGTINVETMDYSDDEGNGNIQSLDSLMADLGNMVKTPRQDTNIPPEKLNQDAENIKYEYEAKIASMTKRIQMMELAMDQPPDRDRQARMNKMQEEYRQLDDRFTRLNKEHKEQQVAVREVKDEIRQLIDELKNLSAKNETLRIQNDNANTKIRSLTEESKSWKTKYDSISMELRSFKVKSVHMDHQDLSKDYFLKPNEDGAIGHQYIIEYQTAIDELMKTSRSSKPADVLFSMRTIVMACKSITTEVEEFEIKVGLSSANQASLYEIKKRFSTELSNLLASAKIYSGGMGISPVSLVDAAAGNLTVTIVDLVKLLGMRPVTDNHSGGDGGPPLQQKNNTKSKPMSFAMTPNQLSQFLKEETDHIVASVQNLLGALRSSDGNLYKIITSIVDIVSNIVNASKNTFEQGEGLKYRNQGFIILNDLDRCNSKIIYIRDTEFTKLPDNTNAVAKRNLAQESYEIAKYTKELINMLDM
ncbi:uncharacterized protein EV154DRAFT_479451 [Mucor mucedo]|uniref:uncharacterized protein n=1 Tax=Mucor mucedo TaxID=29922 RepID=UPI00221ED993|nr:uncharacterized protein EV154DRAFT_479451 [Mucor mucedo]KAI7893447.1 hypothetical protein EV154DRAFT_479451 [Mucor mucedo]